MQPDETTPRYPRGISKLWNCIVNLPSTISLPKKNFQDETFVTQCCEQNKLSNNPRWWRSLGLEIGMDANNKPLRYWLNNADVTPGWSLNWCNYVCEKFVIWRHSIEHISASNGLYPNLNISLSVLTQGHYLSAFERIQRAARGPLRVLNCVQEFTISCLINGVEGGEGVAKF